jgi:hypothetical protein
MSKSQVRSNKQREIDLAFIRSKVFLLTKEQRTTIVLKVPEEAIKKTDGGVHIIFNDIDDTLIIEIREYIEHIIKKLKDE